MNQLLFVGIDVDDNAFHVSIFQPGEGEISLFSCRPEVGKLIKRLESMGVPKKSFRICYESTYLGFSLARSLQAKGFSCVVIASGMIPNLTSDRVKTDKRDCRKLAEYFAKDLLTIVQMPTHEDEVVRNLIRSRQFLVRQIKDLKLHILSICRVNNIAYKLEHSSRNHWTQHHYEWLNKIMSEPETPEVLRLNLKSLLSLLDQINGNLGHYNLQIETLAASAKYQKRVEALVCFRGLATLTAMTLITEIGDIKRFGHPSQLMSYAGLGIREYSSGGNERKYGITKMGNKFIRTGVIEANQQPQRPPMVSRWLKQRREGVSPEIVAIADRCQRRIYKKATKLYHREKNKNKVKVACAREMLGFIWEALYAVAV